MTSRFVVIGLFLFSHLSYAFIINGRKAMDQKYDSVVLINIAYPDGSSGYCTGTVVSHNTILSAAHCFTSVQADHSELLLASGGSVSFISDKEKKVNLDVEPIMILVNDIYIDVFEGKYLKNRKKYFKNYFGDLGAMIYPDNTFQDSQILRISRDKPKLLSDSSMNKFTAVGFGVSKINTSFIDYLESVSEKEVGQKVSSITKNLGDIYLNQESSTLFGDLFLISREYNLCEPSENESQIAPGDSGGPLFNDKNELVGVSSQYFTKSGTSLNHRVEYLNKDYNVKFNEVERMYSRFVSLHSAPSRYFFDRLNFLFDSCIDF